MTRRLGLRSETLGDLSATELAAVAGAQQALPTRECYTAELTDCYTVQLRYCVSSDLATR